MRQSARFSMSLQGQQMISAAKAVSGSERDCVTYTTYSIQLYSMAASIGRLQRMLLKQ